MAPSDQTPSNQTRAPLLLPTPINTTPAVPGVTTSPPRQEHPRCPLCTAQVYQYFLNGKQAVVMCSDTQVRYFLPSNDAVLELMVVCESVRIR